MKIGKQLRRAAFYATRGRLVNVATWLYGLPSAFPNKGPGRELQVRESDVFVVSYPRSGNTWLRFLIGNLVDTGHQLSYAELEDVVPDIYLVSELFLRKMPSPRILKSHESFDPRYKKIIYVARNPLDVAISQFNTLRKLRSEFDVDFSEFVDRHLAGEFDSWFGSWDQHVNSWLWHQQSERLLFVKYEELQIDPVKVLGRISKFLGRDTKEQLLISIVNNSNKDSMEKSFGQSSESLGKQIGGQNAVFLVPNRGAGRDSYPTEQLSRLYERYRPTMEKLGYTMDGLARDAG